MKNIKLFHISGVSGSGKTTLGELLKKRYKDKFIVVDTDDILSIAHHQIKHWKNIYKQSFEKYLEHRMKNVDEILKEIYATASRQQSHIVIVGMSIDLNVRNRFDQIKSNDKYSYLINIDPKVSYRQMMTRDLQNIKSQSSEIQKLINKEDPVIVEEILFHNPYRIRNRFPVLYSDYLNIYNQMKGDKSIILLNANEIIQDILSKIKNN